MAHAESPIARLNLADLARITAAVGEAERRTAGEIVPVILARSDAYDSARWRLGVFMAALAAFFLHWRLPELPAIWLLWAELPALGLGYALGGWPALRRTLLGRGEMRAHVHARALEVFRFGRLDATRDRTGIVILVSLFERQVQILADQGISSRLPQSTWDGVVAGMLKHLGAQDLAAGVCHGVAECGALLAAHFPPRADDVNELPNEPILG